MLHAIWRQIKCKRADVSGLQAEHERTQDDHFIRGRDFDLSDIDWTLTNQNLHLAHDGKAWKELPEPRKNWNKEITRQIQDHPGCKEITKGKNASTVMLDNIFTASPDYFKTASKKEQGRFFKDCLDWYTKEWCQGDPSRIISVEIHLDEETPHMHVVSVPLFESEKGFTLSAKSLCGQYGRNTYHVMQDRFYEAVGQSRGLDRGEVVDYTDPIKNANKKLHRSKRQWQLDTQDEQIQQQHKQIQQQQKIIDTQKDKIKAVQDYDSMVQDDDTFRDFLEWREKKTLDKQIDEQMREGELVQLRDLMDITR